MLIAAASKRDLTHTIGNIVVRESARSPWIRYGLAVLLPCLGFLVNWLVFDLQRAPYFTLFLATVVIATLFGGSGPGLINTTIATALGFLVAPPAWTFRLEKREDGIRIAMFAVLGCLISIIIGIVGNLQRNLNRDRQMLATILQTIGDAVVTTSKDACITFLNDVAERATGWTLKRAVGKPVDEIVRVILEDSRIRIPNPLRTALESGIPPPQCNNCLLVQADGTEIPIVYNAAPIDPKPQGVPGGVFVFRDISLQRETQNALIRAEKLATAGKLSAILAHEVNNPLEATSNLLFLIRLAPDLDIARSYAEVALHETMRAAKAVHQTLAFGKVSEKREPVELEPLIDRVLSLHSNKIIARNVQVSIVCPIDACVQANRGEIEQVVSNLISNSLDAMRHGGTLRVRVTTAKGKVRIVVGDTGCGIPREQWAKLFNAFFTTKAEVGIGLGLWVTKRIVEAHHGQIRLRSSSGKGTVVRVCLQAAPSTVQQS